MVMADVGGEQVNILVTKLNKEISWVPVDPADETGEVQRGI
jgi:hypothetical protein